jgi:iron complex outermembrane receptor protein
LLLPLQAAAATSALADLSLEELADIEIVSVSRRAERLQDAAASIFVITNADIRRSAATTLTEALRLAPNLDVAQVNAGSYAISARGFNNALGNKLLVLIDGRTVYSPIFSGVNWDSQQVMLEDIERIEVISGPGGTMWGANAVNGVINVITKRASDTQGGLVTGTGSNNSADTSFRYGGRPVVAIIESMAWARATTTRRRQTGPRCRTAGAIARPASGPTGERQIAA